MIHMWIETWTVSCAMIILLILFSCPFISYLLCVHMMNSSQTKQPRASLLIILGWFGLCKARDCRPTSNQIMYDAAGGGAVADAICFKSGYQSAIEVGSLNLYIAYWYGIQTNGIIARDVLSLPYRDGSTNPTTTRWAKYYWKKKTKKIDYCADKLATKFER